MYVVYRYLRQLHDDPDRIEKNGRVKSTVRTEDCATKRLLLLILLVQAFREGLGQLLSIKIFPNENELVDALLALCPGIFGRPEVDLLVNALEDKFGIALPVEAQQTLGPVQVGRPVLE